MKNVRFLAIVVCVIAVANFTSADTIRGINIDFVTIDNAGNAADTVVMDGDGTTGYGAVGYNYRIGKYEVTNAQWNAFTTVAGAPTGNDGGYDQSAWYTGDQQPAHRVSWYEASQFCNFLTSGDKSKGAYQFSGNNTNPGHFLGIDRAASISTYGTTYVMPTEDEWYKAAYFKHDGSGYSFYANGQSTIPTAYSGKNYPIIYSTTGWNWYDGTYLQQPWNVGTGTQEQNGTFDMMGNVWEWNEAVFAGYYAPRGIRGGSSYDTLPGGGISSEVWSWWLRSSCRRSDDPYVESPWVGFRIASIPEPATLLLLSLGGLVLRRKRS